MKRKIIVNLMVSDMARSVAFYTDKLGFAQIFLVDPERQDISEPARSVFAMLAFGEASMMLQTSHSLAEELPIFEAGRIPRPSTAIYLHGLCPDAIHARLDPGCVIKAPFNQWYGMRELYVQDPDGHVICIASTVEETSQASEG